MPSKIGELTSLKTMCRFIVGEERNNQIRELQSLDLLGGNLEITHLERVKEKYLDANMLILAEKQHLWNLMLKWENGNPSRCREILDEKVMEVLEPHANVKTLKIVGFQGKNITLWRRRSNPQIKLVELRIEDCHKCEALPQALIEFPHLKKLRMYNLPALEYIVEDEGFDLRSVKFPVLEELVLIYHKNLKGLLKKEVGECYPNLQKLYILGCPSLLSLPQLPSLVDLECSNMNITSVGGNKFENLSTLCVAIMKVEDAIVPKECLTNNLKSLRIDFATNEDILPEEGLQQGLKSLKELSILFGRLRCLPGRWLSHLTSLEKLDLVRCIELVEIPEEIKYLINLKRLTIKGCPKIESIPSTIQQLTQLQTLWISDCSPGLKKRCEKGKGDDWHKIQHIPNIYITDYFGD